MKRSSVDIRLCLRAAESHGIVYTENHDIPWVLTFERDIGALVGAVLKENMGIANEVVAVDGVEVTDLDFVDIGQPLGNRGAVPVVVKSLIFE